MSPTKPTTKRAPNKWVVFCKSIKHKYPTLPWAEVLKKASEEWKKGDNKSSDPK